MSQIRITKPRRTASAGRRRCGEPPLPLYLRDPDITRAKRLQRQARRPAGTSLSPAGQQTTSTVHLTAGPPQ